jgi:hypothetical protein
VIGLAAVSQKFKRHPFAGVALAHLSVGVLTNR